VPLKKAIMFDLGGVLIDWNPRHLYRKVYGEAETEFFLANVCTSSWNLALDGGRSYKEAIAEKQASWPEYREAIAWWETRWAEMLGGPIAATVALLKDLHEREHPLFALTNWSAETFPEARRRYDFLAWFQDIIVSGEEGLVKPDPALYHLAARRSGLAPADLVFIDDSRPNVEAAKSLGFDAIQFTNATALKQGLVKRGFL